jgi:putative nucleotidyltransferase with HDIG domain
MFRFLKKKRLEAKGLSCGKTRLSKTGNRFLEHLEESPLMRAAVLAVASLILATFCLFEGSPDTLRRFLLSLIVLALVVTLPLVSKDSPLVKNSRLLLFLIVTLLQLGMGELIQGHCEAGLSQILIPYALAPIALSVLLGPQTAFFACVTGALWWMVLLHKSDFNSLLLLLGGGLAGILTPLRVRRRSRLLRAGLSSGIAVAVLYLFCISFPLIQIGWSLVGLLPWLQIGIAILGAIGVGLFTGVVISGSLPLIERLFGITTDISLMEMADLNHPLLRRLSLEAPGTYHHSLAMANLAEACAEKVGANSSLCRVSAYFHDIGKLAKPDYFTENIAPGENPHDELTPTMSSLVILSHVKEGVDLGLRHRLNGRIIDAIRQHHGTTLVEFFYQRACRQERDAQSGVGLINANPEDIPRVSEESYRYPGPKPRSVETVILGLADAAESASRSLERPTIQRLDDLVHDLLQDRINDGQYDEAPVTLCQLQEIAATLVSSLGSMLHTRIAYGRRKGDAKEIKEED